MSGQQLKQLVEDIIPCNTKKLYIAFSGGLDSTTLLHVCTLIPYLNIKTVLNVNYSDTKEKAQYLKQFCAKLALPLETVRGDHIKKTQNNWRDFRYKWFSKVMEENSIVLTGHTLNDQAENFILQSMRGSSEGLLMPSIRYLSQEKNIKVARPFLNCPKSSLKKYCQAHNIHWIEDPTNKIIDKHTRNKIRFILRYDQIQGLVKSGNWIEEKNNLLNALIKQTLDQISDQDSLDLAQWFQISKIHRKYIMLLFCKNKLNTIHKRSVISLIKTLEKKLEKEGIIDNWQYQVSFNYFAKVSNNKLLIK